ncbi:MAG TPA: hypothetical protein VIL01_08940 [Thermomicrobiales bacterium]
MFGTIGHVRVKPGHESAIFDLEEEWKRTVRPTIPGEFISLSGAPMDRPGEIVFIALAQDEPTYRALAADPKQDAWFRRMLEHCEGEPKWEDVEMEWHVRE